MSDKTQEVGNKLGDNLDYFGLADARELQELTPREQREALIAMKQLHPDLRGSTITVEEQDGKSMLVFDNPYTSGEAGKK